MRAAVYLRISSDPSGQQLGVTRQREDAVKLCEVKGWTPAEYLDNDISASSGKRRPGYEKMLTDIEAGTIGAVVAWDLDRLHRRPIELEKFTALADEHHLALATVAGDVDLSTAQGRLVARLKGSVAAHEIEQMKARQRRKHEQNAAQGIPHWSRAFGYDADRQPDPVTAPLVKQAYAAVLAGASLADVCLLWNEAEAFTINGKAWTAAQASAFMRKPRNAGLRSHNGEIVGAGNWPPLVDESLWRATLSVLDGRPGRPVGRRTMRRHLLTAVLQCGKPGCGHYLSGQETQKGAIVYQCRVCRGVSVRAEHVEPLLYGVVSGRLAMPDAVDLLKAEIHDEAQAEAVRVELNSLYGELDNIGVERGEGLLTGAQAKIATTVINKKIAQLERRQQDTERLRVFADLPLGKPEVADAVGRLSPDRFRAVLGVLATIIVAPVGKGHRVNGARFDPERVAVTWK